MFCTNHFLIIVGSYDYVTTLIQVKRESWIKILANKTPDSMRAVHTETYSSIDYKDTVEHDYEFLPTIGIENRELPPIPDEKEGSEAEACLYENSCVSKQKRSPRPQRKSGQLTLAQLYKEKKMQIESTNDPEISPYGVCNPTADLMKVLSSHSISSLQEDIYDEPQDKAMDEVIDELKITQSTSFQSKKSPIVQKDESEDYYDELPLESAITFNVCHSSPQRKEFSESQKNIITAQEIPPVHKQKRKPSLPPKPDLSKVISSSRPVSPSKHRVLKQSEPLDGLSVQMIRDMHEMLVGVEAASARPLSSASSTKFDSQVASFKFKSSKTMDEKCSIKIGNGKGFSTTDSPAAATETAMKKCLGKSRSESAPALLQHYSMCR